MLSGSGLLSLSICIRERFAQKSLWELHFFLARYFIRGKCLALALAPLAVLFDCNYAFSWLNRSPGCPFGAKSWLCLDQQVSQLNSLPRNPDLIQCSRNFIVPPRDGPVADPIPRSRGCVRATKSVLDLWI